LSHARSEADRRGGDRGTECREAVAEPDRHGGGPVDRVLQGGRLPPTLLRKQPGAAVLCAGGRAEGGQGEEGVRGQAEGLTAPTTWHPGPAPGRGAITCSAPPT